MSRSSGEKKIGRRRRKPSRVIPRKLGKRIRELREKKGLSQAALARASGLWPDYLGRMERGGTNLRLSTLLKIAGSLDISVQRLFRGIL